MAKKQKMDRLNIRMDSDVMGWMRKAAAKKRMTVSMFARMVLSERFDERHA